MITNANAIAYFAESVRMEASGQQTMIGVFDDIAELPHLPGKLPNIAIHITLSTLINQPFTPKYLRVCFVDGETLASHELPNELAEHQAEAIKNKKDPSSIWMSMKILVNVSSFTAQDGARLRVEFEDDENNVVRSNSLTFRNKRQEPIDLNY